MTTERASEIRRNIQSRYHWQHGEAWNEPEHRNPGDDAFLPEADWWNRVEKNISTMRASAKRVESGDPVQCVETGEVFDSCRDAVSWIRKTKGKHADTAHVRIAVKLRQRCGGYHWCEPGAKFDPTPVRRAGKMVRRLSDGVVFQNQMAAAEAIGIPKTTFVVYVRNGIPAGGSYWELVA